MRIPEVMQTAIPVAAAKAVDGPFGVRSQTASPWATPAERPRSMPPVRDARRAKGPGEIAMGAFGLLAPAAALLLAMAAAPSAAAQSLEEAGAAYWRGDYATAYRGFQRFAEQGAAPAQFNLGVLYDRGRGVRRDFVRAHKWYSLAASLFSAAEKRTRAEQARDRTAAHLTSVELALAQRLARQWRPGTGAARPPPPSGDAD